MWPDDLPGRGWFCLGYGYVIGALLAALLLMLQGVFGFSLHVEGLLVLFGAGLFVGLTRLRSLGVALRFPSTDWASVQWPLLALLAWLLIRGLSLALELFDHGLYAWDAWSTWAFRARVWTEAGELIPFVTPDVWLADRSINSMALPAAHYPKLISLVAAWSALAYGSWNEWASLLPWLLLYPALAFGLYGQCRLWGSSPMVSATTVWLVLSLPLVGGQIALAGYADIWLSVTLGFAFMSFLLWVRDRDARQGILTMALIIFSAMIKSEGLVWGLIFLAAFVGVWLKPSGWLWLLSGLLAAIVALQVSGGFALELPIIGALELSLDRVYTTSTGAFEFTAQQGVLPPLLVHLFVFDTWHLLMTLIVGAVVWRVRVLPSLLRDSSPTGAWERAALIWVLSAFAAFYVLFFWTSASEWVRLGTSGNRIILHFAVALVFWLQCLWTAHIRVLR